MSTPYLVEAFYARIWNDGELAAAQELLNEEFVFRGSLGNEIRGLNPFKDYVRSVRGALANYHCEILECVVEEKKAFAKMSFSGVHIASFRGCQPTGKMVTWLGAALFIFDGGVITELWVLGDLFGLDILLKANAAAVWGIDEQV